MILEQQLNSWGSCSSIVVIVQQQDINCVYFNVFYLLLFFGQ